MGDGKLLPLPPTSGSRPLLPLPALPFACCVTWSKSLCYLSFQLNHQVPAILHLKLTHFPPPPGPHHCWPGHCHVSLRLSLLPSEAQGSFKKYKTGPIPSLQRAFQGSHFIGVKAQGPAQPPPSPPCPHLLPLPLAHSAPATGASSLYLQHASHGPASEPLHGLCPLP